MSIYNFVLDIFIHFFTSQGQTITPAPVICKAVIKIIIRNKFER